MTGNEYQKLAARTMGEGWTHNDYIHHALHGMVGEMGEIHSIYQKRYQGHVVKNPGHLKKRTGGSALVYRGVLHR